VVSVAEVVRVAGGPAARELYAWRGGRGRWRAALSDPLAARLGAAA
jgi:pilus assembly protein CpaF